MLQDHCNSLHNICSFEAFSSYIFFIETHPLDKPLGMFLNVKMYHSTATIYHKFMDMAG